MRVVVAVVVVAAVAVVGVVAAGCPRAKCDAATQLEPRDTQSGPAGFPGSTPAGIESCSSLDFNSTDVVTCSTDFVGPACTAAPGDDGAACTVDGDCGENGRCLNGGAGIGDPGCHCVTVCNTDADCGSGEACVCSAGLASGGGEFIGMIGRSICVAASCRTADDCGGDPCGVMLGPCDDVVGLRCRDAFAGCHSGADCGGGQCAGDESGGWSCAPPSACE